MATSYPDAIQTFEQMENITGTDAPLVKQYQAAMEAGDLATAATILSSITNYKKKIMSGEFFNSMLDTIVTMQNWWRSKYNPAITVSSTAPTSPENKDYWFEVI